MTILEDALVWGRRMQRRRAGSKGTSNWTQVTLHKAQVWGDEWSSDCQLLSTFASSCEVADNEKLTMAGKFRIEFCLKTVMVSFLKHR